MKILMLNWRDLRNPKAGGAEVLTEGILKELATRGHEITLFTARFRDAGGAVSPKEELRDGYNIIRQGGYLTVRFAAYRYWRRHGSKENFDVVIDQIHGLPFFAPLYVRSTKLFAFVHEVAREIWFAMYPGLVGHIGYYVAEPIFFRWYRSTPFITVSESTKKDLIAMGIPEKNISIIPEAIEMPK